MLDHIEYTAAWAAYLLAAVGLLAVWWRVTRGVPWAGVKQALRVLVAAPLLIPAPVAPGHTDWGPAIFVWLFDLTLVEVDDPMRAVPYLIYALFIGVSVLIADAAYRRWLAPNRSV